CAAYSFTNFGIERPECPVWSMIRKSGNAVFPRDKRERVCAEIMLQGESFTMGLCDCLREIGLRPRNFLDQGGPGLVALFPMKIFAQAVCQKVALQDFQPALKTSELRGRLCIQHEDNACYHFKYCAGKNRNYRCQGGFSC